MIHTRWEILLLEPLIEIEIMGVVFCCETKKWDCKVVKDGRIMVIEGPVTVKPIIRWLAEMGLGEDVGNIRLIKDYEPDQFEKEFVEYNTNEL